MQIEDIKEGDTVLMSIKVTGVHKKVPYLCNGNVDFIVPIDDEDGRVGYCSVMNTELRPVPQPDTYELTVHDLFRMIKDFWVPLTNKIMVSNTVDDVDDFLLAEIKKYLGER